MKNLIDILPKKKITTSEVIRALRLNYKISQNQLCEALDFSQANLSSIENGRRKVGIDVATKIAIFFGVDPISLLYPNGLENEIKNYKQIKRSAEKLAV